MPAVRALDVGVPLTVGGGGTPRVTVAPLVMAPLTGVPRTKAPRGGPTPRPLQKESSSYIINRLLPFSDWLAKCRAIDFYKIYFFIF